MYKIPFEQIRDKRFISEKIICNADVRKIVIVVIYKELPQKDKNQIEKWTMTGQFLEQFQLTYKHRKRAVQGHYQLGNNILM